MPNPLSDDYLALQLVLNTTDTNALKSALEKLNHPLSAKATLALYEEAIIHNLLKLANLDSIAQPDTDDSDIDIKLQYHQTTTKAVIHLLLTSPSTISTQPSTELINHSHPILANITHQKLLFAPNHSLAFNTINTFKQLFPNGTPVPTTIAKQTKAELESMSSQILTTLSDSQPILLNTLKYLQAQTEISDLADHLASNHQPDYSTEDVKKNTYFTLKTEHSLNPFKTETFSAINTMMLILESDISDPTDQI
jgi:hypothetical protein